MNLIRLIKISALTVFIIGCGSTSNQSANIANYEAKGNLKSQQNIGCVTPSELNNQLTQPDLYNGLGAFVRAKSTNEIISGFNSEKVWALALNGYLHCDKN